jgi:hypothetical protein
MKRFQRIHGRQPPLSRDKHLSKQQLKNLARDWLCSRDHRGVSVPASRSCRPFLLLACLAGPAMAGDGVPPDDTGMTDQTLVVARNVMPRIAYRGLEPSQNPARVTTTVFPGRVFQGRLDGLLGALVGEDALGETAPVMPTAALRGPQPIAGEPMEPRGGAPLGGGVSTAGAGGGLGATVMAATAGIANTVTAAVLRTGAGP